MHGRLRAAREGRASPGEPLFVFLEPLDAAAAPAAPAQQALLSLGEQGLAPSVLAVAAGSSVRLANETGIYHRVFSYSESNPFDLGVLRRGETRSIELGTPGVVRIYCSLHPSERAVVFIAPSPYFATFRPPGGYEIRGVPPGRYRVHARSESAPAPIRTVTVRSGASVAVEIASLPTASE